jgi:hypothetical protein
MGLLIQNSVPFFAALVIAIAAKHWSRQSQVTVSDEETPLLTERDEPASLESACQEPTSNEPVGVNIQPPEGQ